MAHMLPEVRVKKSSRNKPEAAALGRILTIAQCERIYLAKELQDCVPEDINSSIQVEEEKSRNERQREQESSLSQSSEGSDQEDVVPTVDGGADRPRRKSQEIDYSIANFFDIGIWERKKSSGSTTARSTTVQDSGEEKAGEGEESVLSNEISSVDIDGGQREV